MRKINSTAATCVLKFDGRQLELHGTEVPSIPAILLFYKKRRAKRAARGTPEERLAKLPELKRRLEALRRARAARA
jgi:hypothetical protein